MICFLVLILYIKVVSKYVNDLLLFSDVLIIVFLLCMSWFNIVFVKYNCCGWYVKLSWFIVLLYKDFKLLL